jgi:hypothetical protein
MLVRRGGRANRLLALVGLAVAGGAWLLFHNAGAPYTFAETLPPMVHDFGGGARVVSIIVDSQGVQYSVVGRDGRVHERDYGLSQTENPTQAGAVQVSRTVTNSTRALTPALRQLARLPLSALKASVPGDLLSRVGFSAGDSQETFTEESWFVQSTSSSAQYQARYNGAGLHRV